MAEPVPDPLFEEIVLQEEWLPRLASQLEFSRLLYDLSAVGILAADEREALLKSLSQKSKEEVATELFRDILPKYGLGTFDKFISVLLGTGYKETAKSLQDKREIGTHGFVMEACIDDDGIEEAMCGSHNLSKRIRFQADPEFEKAALVNLQFLELFSKHPEVAIECGVDPKLALLFHKNEDLRKKLDDPTLKNLFFEYPETGEMFVDYPYLVKIFHRNPELAVTLSREPEKVKEVAEEPNEKSQYVAAKLVVKNAQEPELARELANMWRNDDEMPEDLDLHGFIIDERIGMGMALLPPIRECVRSVRFEPDGSPNIDDVMKLIQLGTELAQNIEGFVKNTKVDPIYVKSFEQGSQAVKVLGKQPELVRKYVLQRPEICTMLRQLVDLERRGDLMALGKAIDKVLNEMLKMLESDPEMNKKMFTEVNAFRSFEKAKKQGLVTVVRSRIHLVGKDNAGKTCVKNALLSKQFVENQFSTPGIATNVAICQAETASEDGAWVLQEEGQPAAVIAGALKATQRGDASAVAVAESAKARKPAGTVASAEKGESRPTGNVSGPQLPASRPSVAARPDVGSMTTRRVRRPGKIQPYCRLPGDGDKIVRNFSESSELLDVWKKMADADSNEPVHSSITIWDEGGQEQYLNMQTPFIAEDAVHLLVFDLTQDPNSEVRYTYYRHGTGAIPQPSFGFHTYGGVLRVWLSMLVVSGGGSDRALGEFLGGESADITTLGEAFMPKVASPPCILIGTRAQQPDAQIRDYQEYLKKLFATTEKAQLIDHIVQSETDCSTIPGHPDPFLFYPVECNFASKREIEAAIRQKSLTGHNVVIPQDPNFAKIRHRIIQAAQQYWKKRQLPKRWLILQLLNEFVSKENAIVHRDFLFSVATKACHITDESEFLYAMMYLDALGMIIYKPGSKYRVLNEHIITDPSWLFELFSRFLPIISQEKGRTARIDNEELYDHYPSDLVKVQTEGIMCSRLVKYFLNHVKRAENHRNQMLRLLQDFDVIAPCNAEGSEEPEESSSFYVPCLVQKRLDDKRECFVYQEQERQMYTCPLVLKARTILIWPEPLFFRLVTRFLNKFQPKETIVERNRVVIYDIDLSSHMIALEFLYLDPKYVTATVRFRTPTFASGFHEVKRKCQELRQMILSELNDIKKLGFQNFDAIVCIGKDPRILPTPEKDESDLYINFEEKREVVPCPDEVYHDVYLRMKGDKKLLPLSLVSELSYWYSVEKEEFSLSRADTCSGILLTVIPAESENVTGALKLAVAKALPECEFVQFSKELLGDATTNLQQTTCRSFLLKVVNVIDTWQKRLIDQEENATVGCLLDVCKRVNLSRTTIEEELRTLNPSGVFPSDDAPVSAEIIRSCVNVGCLKWEEIALNLLFSTPDLRQIEDSSKSLKLKLQRVLEEWQLRKADHSVGRLLKALSSAGINRAHVEKNYFDWLK